MGSLSKVIWMLFFSPSEISSKSLMISSSVSYPNTRRSCVTGIFLFLSILHVIIPFLSVSTSSQTPRFGIIFAPWNFGFSGIWRKKTPGERTSWFTTTRSIPLMMNVPLSVIRGIEPRNTSCSLISPVSLLMSWVVALSADSKLKLFLLQVSGSYFGGSYECPKKCTSILRPEKSVMGLISCISSEIPSPSSHL